jgi:hypothetical protein
VLAPLLVRLGVSKFVLWRKMKRYMQRTWFTIDAKMYHFNK